MNRTLVRVGVVLTALLCLGMAGYCGQVWWAKKQAREIHELLALTCEGNAGDPAFDLRQLIQIWRETPWYDLRRRTAFDYFWIPPRTWRELMPLLTGIDLGNNPSTWEAWFNAHPNLVWDDKLKRLVDPKREAKP